MSRSCKFKVARLCVTLIALGLLWSCDTNNGSLNVPPDSRLENVVVVKVKDGDSFSARYEGRDIEVRLFGIDAPERDQPHSRESRLAAVKLLGQSRIDLVVKDQDRYERIVAEAFVSTSERSVNEQLVEQGAAWVYRQYSRSPSLIAAERAARKGRRGLWSLPDADRVPPWTWRKNKTK